MTEDSAEVKPWTHFYWDIFANNCWPFDEDLVTCGRSTGQFQYEDAELSGSHCEFSIQAGKCFLKDLDSKNGTYLNQKEIEKSVPIKLKSFDVVIFGSQIIVYLDENIFKVESREDLVEAISFNVDNQNILNQIKTKALLFMKADHPRLIINKKILVLKAKIVSAYNLKEEKLSKYDKKIEEVKGIIGQHQEKVKSLEEKIALVLAEKEKMTAKIDPQIDTLHTQVNDFNNEIEALLAKTTA